MRGSTTALAARTLKYIDLNPALAPPVGESCKPRLFINMKMKAAQISKAGGDWELVERDVPEPGDGQVRVKVEACGICHSDVLVKDGLLPGLRLGGEVPRHLAS